MITYHRGQAIRVIPTTKAELDADRAEFERLLDELRKAPLRPEYARIVAGWEALSRVLAVAAFAAAPTVSYSLPTRAS